MRIISTSLWVLAGALLAGCATDRNEMVLNPVGPAPGQFAATTESGAGSLVVYSAYDVNPDFNLRDEDRPRYTDYQILTVDGRMLKFVHNDTGTILQRPVSVSLPAGNYRVMARANGLGRVAVPVIIASGQVTSLHLERDFSLAR